MGFTEIGGLLLFPTEGANVWYIKIYETYHKIKQRVAWNLIHIIKCKTKSHMLLNICNSLYFCIWHYSISTIKFDDTCLQQYFIPTSRELSRLLGIRRAPILHHFAESLSGAATVRAFDQELRFSISNFNILLSFTLFRE